MVKYAVTYVYVIVVIKAEVEILSFALLSFAFSGSKKQSSQRSDHSSHNSDQSSHESDHSSHKSDQSSHESDRSSRNTEQSCEGALKSVKPLYEKCIDLKHDGFVELVDFEQELAYSRFAFERAQAKHIEEGNKEAFKKCIELEKSLTESFTKLWEECESRINLIMEGKEGKTKDWITDEESK